MLQLFVNAEGGLTTAGYVLSGALMALFLLGGLPCPEARRERA